MTTQYIYKKYRSTKTILCNYSRYPLLIIQLRVSFPFVTIIAYDLARGVTQIKLLFLCFFCVKNERAKYYIFRWLCVTLLCKVCFFSSSRWTKKEEQGIRADVALSSGRVENDYALRNNERGCCDCRQGSDRRQSCSGNCYRDRIEENSWYIVGFFFGIFYFNTTMLLIIPLSLFSENEKISYEIIKYPYHSYENTHSTSFDYDHGGSWERDFGHQRQKVNRKLIR